MAPRTLNIRRLLHGGSGGRHNRRAAVNAQKTGGDKEKSALPRRAQPSSSGAMSPSIRLLTSSSSSSSSSRNASSSAPAPSSSTSMSSTAVSVAFSSPASASSSDTTSTPCGAASSVSSSSSFEAGRTRWAPRKTVPHFGQTIGSLLRSKNFAPQF